MTTFKKGQRVWWDPNNEHSGEYDVLDPQGELNMGKPETNALSVSATERRHGMSRPIT